MWLTRPSTLFRKDLGIARLCASPLVAVSHWALAAAIVTYLNSHPTAELSGFAWIGFALVPGAWLFASAMLYMMLLSLKMTGAPIHTIFCGVVDTWKSVLLRREALSVVAWLALIQGITTWHQHQQFDQDDYQSCIVGLQEPGLQRLAQSLTQPMARQDFRAACWDAYSIPLTHAVKPATADELRKRYAPR
jgi:hypothetical protein